MNTGNVDYNAKAGVTEPVVRDMERQLYSLDHYTMKTGAIGSLQTLSVIPIVAGDSIELDAGIVTRLSPLRRNSYLDLMIDIFCFFVPHRHIYGTDWVTYMKAGIDEGTTFGTDSMQTDANLWCCGLYHSANIALPKWLPEGYMQIWNRYFKDPTQADSAVTELGTLAASSPILKYGKPCCHLKRIWNTGVVDNKTTADYRVALTDTNTTLDLYDFAAMQGRLQTEQSRDWYALRYQDVLQHAWKAGAGLNIDADQRPELIARTSQWLSGHDVDGTDDATLGRYSGKMVGMARISFPYKFFHEHGALWLMMLVRYPPIYATETHYLVVKSEPTYKQIAGDPDVLRREQPVTILASDMFHGNDSTDLGKIPYGNWYREQPNMCHFDYVNSAGHPFINPGPIGSRAAAVYIADTLYDSVFLTTQLKHWNCQGYIAVDAKRFIPTPESSIFAGTQP